MLAIKILVWILEFVFFAGMIGSAVVVLLTGIEDIDELMVKNTKDDTQPKAESKEAFLQPSNLHT